MAFWKRWLGRKRPGEGAARHAVGELVSEAPRMVNVSGSSTFDLGGSFETRPPRTVIQAPVIEQAAPTEPPPADGEVRIKAQPSTDGSQCRFLLSRAVLPGRSWWYPDAASAAGSPLAAGLLAHAEVDTVLVDDATVVVALPEGEATQRWEPLARELGARIRAQLESGEPPVDPALVASIPAEDEIRQRVQDVIDTTVNPGVAAHSGLITLSRVRGNSVYIEMGGGCQGCSAADLTLKQGIHHAFRSAVPGLGAIYDETDHAAGENPFYRGPSG
ncbi:MAG: NifU family protein [Myxococcota bacterium]|nr:NifU family protein [Myxococcota bacterium]